METKKIFLNIIYSVFLAIIAFGIIYTIVKNKAQRIDDKIDDAKLGDYFKSSIEKNKTAQHFVLYSSTINETEIKEYKLKVKDRTTTSIFEISAPVKYIYYIDMGEDWSFLLVGNVLRIVAPEIKLEPPSAELDKMRTNIMGGANMMSEIGKLDEFKKEFNSIFKERGMNAEYLGNVRENARISLAIFINNWINSDLSTSNDKIRSILLKFKNEEKFPKLGYSLNTGKAKSPNEQQ